VSARSRGERLTLLGLALGLQLAALSTLIVASLFLVYELDNPFDGWSRVAPDVMQRELARIVHGTAE
jgi:hypothetical protein